MAGVLSGRSPKKLTAAGVDVQNAILSVRRTAGVLDFQTSEVDQCVKNCWRIELPSACAPR